MATQFFERQDDQRRYTRWLVVGFVVAMLAVIAVINVVVLFAIDPNPMRVLRHYPQVVYWVTAAVAGTILVASWHKASQLRAGGAFVARSLGGVAVTPNETDFARKRLLNVVEEMAIAARIRKPQVYVLPDEPAINAFAAGHSPDEAAVAVTQGALDHLDRDQLQAIVAHEFSHVLNGDMRLNMRLAAWIFGLWVITDIAVRLMRQRGGRKKDGRLFLVALGVFIAGSIGMLAGRLLQAAVSRRREHLADASAVQFTRNPQALQGAFITMAASAHGSRLVHPAANGVAHMFFAASEPAWAHKFGGSLFATHPSIEDRVHELDSRITPIRFKALVNDERRKLAARAAGEGQGEGNASGDRPGTVPPDANPSSPAAATAGLAAGGAVLAAAVPAAAMSAAPAPAPSPSGPPEAAPTADAGSSGSHRGLGLKPANLELAETLPTGVRLVAGKALPPDVLRNRLGQEQQSAILAHIARVESSTHAVQGTFVALMLASEPAKWRTQLAKLAPVLGIELLKATQAEIAHVAALPPAARMPVFTDLLAMLETFDPADRKRLRAVARAFAPTVATGDMLRYAVTRVLGKRLAKAQDESPPVPLPDRAADVCAVYAAIAHCRGAQHKQAQNAYRAGLMGLMPPQKWAPFTETLPDAAALDAMLASVARIHPTGKRSFSEGLARVIAVGGQLTVPQVDLLRGVCLLVDCPVPLLPVDVVFEDSPARAPAPLAKTSQANAR